MPWLNTRWVSFFGACTALMITVVSIVGWQNFKDGISHRDKFNAYGVDLNSQDLNNLYTNWTSAQFVLGALITVDSFDPAKSTSTLGFHMDLAPINNLSAVEFGPAVPIRLVISSKTVNFPANISMPAQTGSELLDGDINSYPFDAYTVDYYIYAFTSPANGSYGTPLPLTTFVQGTVQGWSVSSVFQGLLDDGSSLQITFTIKRSAVSKAFAIIIFLVMWFLSLSIFVAAMTVWFREKKVEPPLIAISTALLFALPNVRNSMPGIPTTAGTTSDMVGFFWNLLLVAISAISLLINYIIKNKRERPAPKPSDLESNPRKGEGDPLLSVKLQ